MPGMPRRQLRRRSWREKQRSFAPATSTAVPPPLPHDLIRFGLKLKSLKTSRFYMRATMYAGPMTRGHRPRELRRRVLLTARMRTSAGWSDACILNVSSRGLLINANQTVVQGSNIELRHREHVIAARVVWRSGSRAGLHAEDWVPVDEILILSRSSILQLTAGGSAQVERRKQPRTHDDSRLLGRTIEFASIAIIAITLSCGLYSLVAEALGEPMARIRIALGGG